jgi:hypothetical protein
MVMLSVLAAITACDALPPDGAPAPTAQPARTGQRPEPSLPAVPPRLAGEVRLESGLAASYAYHFDRNAIADSRLTGDALIALTCSGNLVRFDARTFAPTHHHAGASAAVCLGTGGRGEVLAGFRDGTLAEVAPSNLSLRIVARLPAEPLWIGGRRTADGMLAVAKRPVHRRADPDEDGMVLFHVTGANDIRKSPLEAPDNAGPEGRVASAFLLDRRDRLWLGRDTGEWGGWCGYVDAPDGRFVQVPEWKYKNLYGFTELEDGRILAYGGMLHMLLAGAAILRVSPTVEKVLDVPDRIPETGPRPVDRPRLPVDRILQERDTRDLLVSSFGQVFRTDSTLQRWTFLRELKTRCRPGRPDAIASYPALSTAHAPGGGRLLCATRRDGYVTLEGDRQTSHALVGQLGAERITGILRGTHVPFLLESAGSGSPWCLRGNAWEIVPVLPDGRKQEHEAWQEARVTTDKEGDLIAFCGTNCTPGSRVTVRWKDGRPSVLAAEQSDSRPAQAFVTPDGTPWITRSGKLLNLAGGTWTTVGEAPEPSPGLRAASDAGPPWILFSPTEDRLYRLTCGPGQQTPRLEQVQQEPGIKIHDATPWTDGNVLLATSAGLRVYDPASGHAIPGPVDLPSRDIRAVCRDGSGRLWASADRVWMWDGSRLHDMGAVPMLDATSVSAMEADPEHPDGVILALGRRGVLFVHASP